MITPLSQNTATPMDRAALRKAAEGFEAAFLREIIGEMRKAKLGDDIFGSGASDNFREMADANTADALAKRGLFGIAEMVERQFAVAAGDSPRLTKLDRAKP
jgi:peptidoglycan hydrolase FlgJ